MNIRGRPCRTMWELPEADAIEVIDQRALPHRFVTAVLRTPEEVATAIRDMVIRGAPLIGAVAGYGLHFALRTVPDAKIDQAVSQAAELLEAARPTAVNLRWAVRFVAGAIRSAKSPADKRKAALEAARQIVEDELDRSRRMGQAGLALIRAIASRKNGGEVQVMTHCNAGWLATIDYGTATAPLYAAHEAGVPIHVWVSETRPRNQGASLTAFELGEHGVRHTLAADNACGHLLQMGKVDLVIVGADRVAANGDTANKIGTYLKALAASAAGVPFYVALPSSTIDWSLPNGKGIPIEERCADEVRYIDGVAEDGPRRVLITPETTPACNPAFDVTPAQLVTAFITEHGVVRPAELAAKARTGS
jgi:methylthioribose-1-phosphate isomerase